jgi:hypothetical protein
VNVGYWTRQHEGWFISRRSRIREALRSGDDRKLELKSAFEWRKSLRYEFSRQKHFLSRVQKLSDAILM